MRQYIPDKAVKKKTEKKHPRIIQRRAEDEILNRDNDFIRADETRGPNAPGFTIWLNQYKFTPNAKGKIG